MDARLLFLWGANHLSFPSLPCTWAVLEQAAHQAILKSCRCFSLNPLDHCAWQWGVLRGCLWNKAISPIDMPPLKKITQIINHLLV